MLFLGSIFPFDARNTLTKYRICERRFGRLGASELITVLKIFSHVMSCHVLCLSYPDNSRARKHYKDVWKRDANDRKSSHKCLESGGKFQLGHGIWYIHGGHLHIPSLPRKHLELKVRNKF